MNQKIINFILNIDVSNISKSRKDSLNDIIKEIKKNTLQHKASRLIFICTHNSRRSIFSEVWSQTFIKYYNLNNIYTFSGGTEVSKVYSGVINTLIKNGFKITNNKNQYNPTYSIYYGKQNFNIKVKSKLYSSSLNPTSNLIAIMNCSSAEKSCPFIPGASARIYLPFDDPKESDGSQIEVENYRNTNLEIASSMKYLFMNI